MHNVIPITRSTKRPRNSFVARIVPARQVSPQPPHGFVAFAVTGNIVAPIMAREGQLLGLDLSGTLTSLVAVGSADGRRVFRRINTGSRHVGNVVRELVSLVEAGALTVIDPSHMALLLQFLRTGSVATAEVHA